MSTWGFIVLSVLALIGAVDVIVVIALCVNAWLRAPADSYPRMYGEE